MNTEPFLQLIEKLGNGASAVAIVAFAVVLVALALIFRRKLGMREEESDVVSIVDKEESSNHEVKEKLERESPFVAVFVVLAAMLPVVFMLLALFSFTTDMSAEASRAASMLGISVALIVMAALGIAGALRLEE